MKIWKSKSGQMYYSENAEGLESYTSDNGTWVSGDMLLGDAVLIYDSNAQPSKVEVDPEEARIDKALAVIKERYDLCYYFDDAVDRAKNLSLLDRLEFVAFEEGRMDLHTELVKELNKPTYEPPAVPDSGDYVKVTYLDGDTVEGEVGTVMRYRDYNKVGFTGFQVGKSWTVIPEPGSVYFESQPHRIAVTIKSVERPVEPVEIDGYWVARREEHNDVAAWGSKDFTNIPVTTAYSLEEAYEKIKASSDVTYMRKYIPALLAIAKFFEQEGQ